MNLVNHTDTVVDVGEKAGKEYNIEKGMAKMKNDDLQLVYPRFQKA